MQGKTDGRRSRAEPRFLTLIGHGRAAFAVTHNTPIIEDVVVCFPAVRAGYEAARIHHYLLGGARVTMALLQNGLSILQPLEPRIVMPGAFVQASSLPADALA